MDDTPAGMLFWNFYTRKQKTSANIVSLPIRRSRRPGPATGNVFGALAGIAVPKNGTVQAPLAGRAGCGKLHEDVRVACSPFRLTVHP